MARMTLVVWVVGVVIAGLVVVAMLRALAGGEALPWIAAAELLGLLLLGVGLHATRARASRADAAGPAGEPAARSGVEQSPASRWDARALDYEALLTQAPIVIGVAARDGTLVFLNRLVGEGDPAELIGRSMFEFLPDPEGAARGAIEAVFDRGETVEVESAGHRLDGHAGVFRLHLAPLRQGGEVVACVGVAQDVSHVRELQNLRARFVEDVVDAQEQERRRVARELHDVTAQALTSLLIGLRGAAEVAGTDDARLRLAELRALTSRTVEEVGRLARGLHPSVLDDVGFVAALERFTAEFAQAHSIPTDLELLGLGDARLPAAVETTLYRIAQEALTNIAKHAAAQRVSLVVERRPSELRAIIEDDGRGFRLDERTGLPAGATGLGLLGIRERAELVGGTLTIESGEGAGTTLYVDIPISARSAAQRLA